MRLPSWLSVKRQRTYPDAVEVDLGVDMDQLRRQIALMGKAFQAMGVGMSQVMSSAVKAAASFEREMAKLQALGKLSPVQQAGLEARYYVRGGLDPLYATPEARDRYVRQQLHMPHGHIRAAAFLHGWVVHRLPEPQPPECNGICVWASELIECGTGVAYPHPDCDLHGDRVVR